MTELCLHVRIPFCREFLGPFSVPIRLEPLLWGFLHVCRGVLSTKGRNRVAVSEARRQWLRPWSFWDCMVGGEIAGLGQEDIEWGLSDPGTPMVSRRWPNALSPPDIPAAKEFNTWRSIIWIHLGEIRPLILVVSSLESNPLSSGISLLSLATWQTPGSGISLLSSPFTSNLAWRWTDWIDWTWLNYRNYCGLSIRIQVPTWPESLEKIAICHWSFGHGSPVNVCGPCPRSDPKLHS